MARPKKTNADYFSHDTGMRNDLKIKAVRRKFGLTGYAVWCMLLEVITDSENLELEYNDESVELISADFDLEPSEIQAIIMYCLQLRLLTNYEGLLASETLKKRLLPLFNKRDRQLSTTITPKIGVIDSENPQSKVKESKVKESKENTYSESDFVCSEFELHFSILQYFEFTEMRNPDKLDQIVTFLNILQTDGKIEMFIEQFKSYKTYKEKSTTAKHAFPNFLGHIEDRYLDGAWNQENWTAKVESLSSIKDEDSPFNKTKMKSLRERILNGEA